ncbi:hypothetical protein BDV23DRAFT_50242 [Aspergillus alliaceus]|uniref:Uncharacterized protein n=1 Tax=Petromyces alliaceus TaxID=209559 RepID=A0A5N7CFV9_PETAA|nr:hypothetical protein BDV23DRAFT_50242 [Aspergillus alliaceus]
MTDSSQKNELLSECSKTRSLPSQDGTKSKESIFKSLLSLSDIFFVGTIINYSLQTLRRRKRAKQ